MKRLSAICLVLGAFPLLSSAGDDPKDRTPVKITGRQKAPEFVDVFDWINSKPLTMADLKGKVVVVHFMAFG